MKSLIQWLVVLVISTSTSAETFDVQAGDTRGFLSAFEAASQNGEPDKIILQGGSFEFEDVGVLQAVADEIEIIGNAANFSRGIAFEITESGRLSVSQVAFVEVRVLANTAEGFFVNYGSLILEQVVFLKSIGRAVSTAKFFGVLNVVVPEPLIRNYGHLSIDRSSFVFSGITGLEGMLNNQGTAYLENVQFVNSLRRAVVNESGVLDLNHATFVDSGPFITDAHAITTIANSIFVDTECSGDGQVTSAGQNTFTDNTCAPNGMDDIVRDYAANLIARRQLGVDLLAHEPLVPSVDGAFRACPEFDALSRRRSLGRNPIPLVCDRGAVETRPLALLQGGASGVFYDPASDGHYVTVLENDANTLVIWNTFDRAGNAVSILATGELREDGLFSGAAFTNVGGQLTEFGPPKGQQPQAWGTLSVLFKSCTSAVLQYQSDDPTLGEGEVPLTRLAFTDQVGCVDL